jgi:hypothetical protein
MFGIELEHNHHRGITSAEVHGARDVFGWEKDAWLYGIEAPGLAGCRIMIAPCLAVVL